MLIHLKLPEVVIRRPGSFGHLFAAAILQAEGEGEECQES